MDFVKLFQSVVDLFRQILGKTPNYKQAKENKLEKLEAEYEKELLKDLSIRDDAKLTRLRNEIKRKRSLLG